MAQHTTKKTHDKKDGRVVRPPVVVVLGHVDHGKSTLLDYIRSSQDKRNEAGGITQHTAAYEVSLPHKDNKPQRITFLDTPGHAAFAAQRERGVHVADIAVLVVAADDGVKAQTAEALEILKETNLPFVVAINKTDTAGADIEKTIASLAEHNVFLEGRGGDVAYVPLSAKTGDGVEDLLDIVILSAELEELSGNPDAIAQGVVVEAHRDDKKGVTATLIITDGTLRKGECVASHTSFAPVRSIEDMSGKSLESASFSSPVRIVGWDSIPEVGRTFVACENKKQAEKLCNECKKQQANKTHPEKQTASASDSSEEHDEVLVPLIIKADTAGTLDAVLAHTENIEIERVLLKVLLAEVGNITENDIKTAGGDEQTLVIGFNVRVENAAQELAKRAGITVKTFTIIYELTEWLEKKLMKRKPTRMVEVVQGSATILKIFSTSGKKQVLGARLTDGVLKKGDRVRITRRDEYIGDGTILELQQNRTTVNEIADKKEFGLRLSSPITIAKGDTLEAIGHKEE